MARPPYSCTQKSASHSQPTTIPRLQESQQIQSPSKRFSYNCGEKKTYLMSGEDPCIDNICRNSSSCCTVENISCFSCRSMRYPPQSSWSSWLRYQRVEFDLCVGLNVRNLYFGSLVSLASSSSTRNLLLPTRSTMRAQTQDRTGPTNMCHVRNLQHHTILRLKDRAPPSLHREAFDSARQCPPVQAPNANSPLLHSAGNCGPARLNLIV